MGGAMSLVLQSTSGGSVTINEPTTASNFTQTLPAATGTVMVSGNMPAFSAYVNTNQTGLTTSTTVKNALNTEIFDTASCFNNTGSTVGGIPAYAFLPNVAGYYQFNFVSYVTGDTANLTSTQISIRKNGTGVVSGNYLVYTSAGGFVTNASGLIYLNGSTDYVDFVTYATTASGTWSIRADSSNTLASGFLARAA